MGSAASITALFLAIRYHRASTSALKEIKDAAREIEETSQANAQIAKNIYLMNLHKFLLSRERNMSSSTEVHPHNDAITLKKTHIQEQFDIEAIKATIEKLQLIKLKLVHEIESFLHDGGKSTTDIDLRHEITNEEQRKAFLELCNYLYDCDVMVFFHLI